MWQLTLYNYILSFSLIAEGMHFVSFTSQLVYLLWSTEANNFILGIKIVYLDLNLITSLNSSGALKSWIDSHGSGRTAGLLWAHYNFLKFFCRSQVQIPAASCRENLFKPLGFILILSVIIQTAWICSIFNRSITQCKADLIIQFPFNLQTLHSPLPLWIKTSNFIFHTRTPLMFGLISIPQALHLDINCLWISWTSFCYINK